MLMYAHSIWSEAMKSLRRNRIRTVLTILSLVVGIAAFICVVGVGKAGSAKVEQQLQKLGDNIRHALVSHLAMALRVELYGLDDHCQAADDFQRLRDGGNSLRQRDVERLQFIHAVDVIRRLRRRDLLRHRP